MMKESKNRGQVILIILLITTVGLTIGLSLVSRTITDIKVSTQITESSKAFSAAESGIEAALKGTSIGDIGSLDLGGGASANYAVTEYGNSDDPLVFKDVAAGDAKTIWLVKHDEATGNILTPPDTNGKYDSQRIEICWGKDLSNPSEVPAVEVSLLYYDTNELSYKMGTLAFDDNDSRVNGFEKDVDNGNTQARCSNENRRYNVELNFSANTDYGFNANASFTRVALMVKPLYAQTDVVIGTESGKNLPSQGKQITSTGTTTSGTARKISVVQGHATLPPIFGYTLFTT